MTTTNPLDDTLAPISLREEAMLFLITTVLERDGEIPKAERPAAIDESTRLTERNTEDDEPRPTRLYFQVVYFTADAVQHTLELRGADAIEFLHITRL